MTSSNEKDAVGLYPGTERRTQPHLRAVFERAYEIAFPLLDPKRNLQGAGSAHFLRVVLHDAFPELHQQDVAILSVAIERVFRERNKPDS